MASKFILMKTLFLFAAMYFFLPFLKSQDCNDLESWGKLLEAEFPGVNLGSIRSGSAQSNRMLFNLYSDKYFLPISSKPYDELSPRSRQASASRLKRCQRKKTNLQAGTKLWLNYFGTGPLANEREAPLVAQRVGELRVLRKRYDGILKDLRSGDMEYLEVQRLKQVVGREFALLLPSEISSMVDALAAVGTELADKSLLAKATKLEKIAPNLALVARLSAFARVNAALYQASTPATRSKAESIVSQKLDETLAVVLAEERTRLEAISLTDPDALKDYFLFDKRIREIYSETMSHARVKQLMKLANARKTTYIAGQRSALETEIDGATTEKSLLDLMNFLDKLEKGNPDVVALQQRTNERLVSVRNQLQREAQARQVAENKRQQAAMQEAQARAAAANAGKQKVAALRDRLRLKYGVNFPTIEQLFYVKAYGAPIVGRVNDATQNQFINYVENLGYMLANRDRELYSNSNRFKNRRGYVISTHRILDKSKEKTIFFSSSLTIINAPRDIIELYHLELTNLYRPIDAIRKQPVAMAPTGDFESNNYVESGGTLYSVNVDEGNLSVSALDNLDALFDVMAGETSPGALKITGFTDKTHLNLAPGEKVTLKASGSVKLGVFAGTSSPAGVDGFRAYNVVSNLPHGALIGRFTGGQWFLVGRGGTFTAPKGGTLRLIINDKDRRNNEGAYEVTYRQ